MSRYMNPNIMRGLQKKKSSFTCNLGHKHRSGLEAKHCDILTLLKRDGKLIEIEYQVNLRLVVNGIKICTHIPDFIVTYPDGHKEIIESKGFVNETFPMKHKLTMALYPEYKYSIWTK